MEVVETGVERECSQSIHFIEETPSNLKCMSMYEPQFEDDVNHASETWLEVKARRLMMPSAKAGGTVTPWGS